MRVRVVLHGIIRGEGRDATCTIDAVRTSLPGTPGVLDAVRWSIRDISQSLPDGNYEVFADRERVQVRIVNGECLFVASATI
jgi:hypothetical protein